MKFNRYILTAVFVMAATSFAADVIDINVSYKIILNPANGDRPDDGNGNEITNAQINEAIDEMNALQETYFRGYRFVRAGAIIEIGGQGQVNGPSQWFDTDFFANNGGTLKDQMQTAAMANPNLYQWRNDAINVYMTNGICGGICSFPDEGDEIVIIGGCSAANGPLHLHELGHYFDLCHTQGCPCGSCDADESGACHTVPDSDDISDTLPDLQCWDQDDIANWSFGADYDQISGSNRRLVDDTFFNIMSYHSDEVQLTELQLDVWSDIANTDRAPVVDGRMIFAESSPFLGNGSSLNPYNTIDRAVLNANSSGDIIMLYPSSFDETLIIDKRVTLRATRQGSAIIGASTSPSVSTPAPLEVQITDLLDKVPHLLEKSPETRLDFAGGE